MSDGINPNELNEAPQQRDEVKEAAEIKPEVKEAAVSLEKATLKPEENVEAEGDIQRSEDLEKEAKAAVDAIPEAADAKPAEITLEAAETEGSMIIEGADPAADGRPGTLDGGEGEPEGGAVTEGEMDPDPVDAGEGKTTDLPAGSGAETVMIDTVPLPESPAAETAADGRPMTEDGGEATGKLGDGETGREGEPAGGTVTESEMDPDPVDTRESPAMATDADTVKIDTVTLPEKPATTAEATSREAIGTWPTPDSGEDPAFVADYRVETESPTPPADPDSGVSPNLPEADLSSPDQGADFEAAQDLEADQSENDQLANLDIQNTLQHQQQLINMLQGMASALQNTRDAIDRKADDGSYQAEVQEDSGREIREYNSVSLASELENAVDQSARMQELMSNIMLKLETSSDQQVQNLKDGETNPDTSSAELMQETYQGSDSTSIATEFEDFDQKANQLFSILSSALKSMQEAESAIKRNLDGGDPENEQPEESPTEASPATAKNFMDYNRELAGIVQQAETALGDTGETETGENGGGNPDYPDTNPAGEGDPGFDQAGHDSTTADYSAELEEINDSEITIEKADLGIAPSQTELNALEAELSAVNKDLAKFTAQVEAIIELKSAVREEISCLQEELMNWPDDGSTREITYSDWIQNADGSFTETQYTKTMTKAEVENLVEKLEALLETMGDQSQMDMLKLQDAMNAQAQLMQMISNLSKMFHDTAMAIVRNLK